MHNCPSFVLSVLLCLCGSPLPSAWSQAGADTVQLRDGTTVRGSVTRVSPEAIAVESNGATKTLATADIKRLRFAEDPALLRQAREAIEEGRPEQAASLLERVNIGEIQNRFIQEDAEFLQAFAQARLALQQGSGETDAARALVAFDRAHPESFHHYRTAETLGDLALRLEKPEAALPYFNRIAAARAASLQLHGKLKEADCLRLMGGDRIAEALQRYEEVLAAPPSDTQGNRSRQWAIVGKARCEAQSDRAQAGVDSLEQLIAESDVQDQELLAAAYNALGECRRRLEQPDDALLAYLHVDLLFPTTAEMHAEALYYLSKLFEQRGQADRATDARNRLQTRYGTSLWARKS